MTKALNVSFKLSYAVAFNVEVRVVEENGNIDQLVTLMLQFEQEISGYCKPQSLKEILRLWLCNSKPLNTADCMRAELLIRYNAT